MIAKRLSSSSFIACSEPFGVMFTDIGETTIALEWNKPAIPNGIVDGYVVRINNFGDNCVHIYIRSSTQLTVLPKMLVLRQNRYNL